MGLHNSLLHVLEQIGSPKRGYGSVLCWIQPTQHALPAMQDEVAHAGLLRHHCDEPA